MEMYILDLSTKMGDFISMWGWQLGKQKSPSHSMPVFPVEFCACSLYLSFHSCKMGTQSLQQPYLMDELNELKPIKCLEEGLTHISVRKKKKIMSVLGVHVSPPLPVISSPTIFL